MPAETESPVSTPEVVTPSGPSPFAPSKPLESPSRNSFDLNALWNGQDPNKSADGPTPSEEEPSKADAEGEAMEIDSDNGEINDKDFDMLLQENTGGQEKTSTVAEQQVNDEESFEKLPLVWSGTVSTMTDPKIEKLKQAQQITMPLDSVTPLAPSVDAKQIGGRVLEIHSGLWETLFTSATARIDGRVAVQNSTQYLVTTRLNAAKELIAVSFAPSSNDEIVKFNELIDYLVKKE